MNRKNGKVPLILQAITMYVIYTTFIIFCFVVENEVLENAFLLIFWFAFLFCFITGIANIIVAIYHFFKKSESPTRVTMITKLALIPWYVINIIFWSIAFAICINPWLLIAAPIIALIGIGSTYFFMICTSAHNISYVFQLLRDKKIKLTGMLLVCTIVQFMFVLDTIGSILLHWYLKQQLQIENNDNSTVIIDAEEQSL